MNSYYRPVRPPYAVIVDGKRFALYSALGDAARCANDLATDTPHANVTVEREGRILFHGCARSIPATDTAIDRSFDTYR